MAIRDQTTASLGLSWPLEKVYDVYFDDLGSPKHFSFERSYHRIYCLLLLPNEHPEWRLS